MLSRLGKFNVSLLGFKSLHAKLFRSRFRVEMWYLLVALDYQALFFSDAFVILKQLLLEITVIIWESCIRGTGYRGLTLEVRAMEKHYKHNRSQI